MKREAPAATPSEDVRIRGEVSATARGRVGPRRHKKTLTSFRQQWPATRLDHRIGCGRAHGHAGPRSRAPKRVCLPRLAATASNMTKTHVEWEGPAVTRRCTRSARLHRRRNRRTRPGPYARRRDTAAILYDAKTRRLLGSSEAFALGQLRTGAASGVGRSGSRPDDADELALIGTGKHR